MVDDILGFLFGSGLIVGIVLLIIYACKANYYPSIKVDVDISNRRISSADEALDFYIINYGTSQIENHLNVINQWKKEKIEKCRNSEKKINKLQTRWHEKCEKAFKFRFYRMQTRYRQVNYVKSSYKVAVFCYIFNLSDDFLLNRIRFLKSHDFYVTVDQYHKKDQRRALTKQLREFIKTRDNYTCQICGKYMPDEVGLHIDHIIPVSKGGKSVPENLRVLCSKCNGRKGNSLSD